MVKNYLRITRDGKRNETNVFLSPILLPEAGQILTVRSDGQEPNQIFTDKPPNHTRPPDSQHTIRPKREATTDIKLKNRVCRLCF